MTTSVQKRDGAYWGSVFCRKGMKRAIFQWTVPVNTVPRTVRLGTGTWLHCWYLHSTVHRYTRHTPRNDQGQDGQQGIFPHSKNGNLSEW